MFLYVLLVALSPQSDRLRFFFGKYQTTIGSHSYYCANFPEQNKCMVRCRNFQKTLVIEIIPSPSIKDKLIANFRILSYNPVSSV